jgi:hypothetical protein
MRHKILENTKKIAHKNNIKANDIIKIIRENTESGCTEKFEQKLFGELKRIYGNDIEANTKYEQWVFDELYNFISGDYDEKDKDTIEDIFEDLLNCKNKYENILKPDGIDTIYRGKNEEFNKLAALEWDDGTDVSDKHRIYKAENYLYKPHSRIQSWSSTYESASKFGDSFPIDGKMGITLETSAPSDELLFDPDFLNKLKFNEDEIIRVGGEITCEVYMTVNVRLASSLSSSDEAEFFKEIDPSIFSY